VRSFPQSGLKCFLAQRLTLYSLLAGVAICEKGCANVASIPSAPQGPQAISGAVVDATVGDWSCNDPGPAQFDGSYAIERLTTGNSYLVYAESLNGAVDPSEISNATASLCRNSTSDPGWPSLQGCVAPPVDVSFTVRTQPGP
jgi:hypothetical protein